MPPAEDRRDRPALDPLRRSRPDPAPVHARPRPPRRDRKGRPPRPQPLRRTAGAVLRRAPGAAPGPRRAADGHRRRHRRRPTRACASMRRRSTRPPGPAMPSRGCSRPPTRTRRCSRCWPTSWRCSAPTPPAPARQRARLPPQAAVGGRDRAAAGGLRVCGEGQHLSGFSGAAGGVVCGACEAGAFTLDEEAYVFLVGALGASFAQAPDGTRALRRSSARSRRPPSITRTCGCGRCWPPERRCSR